MWSLEDWDRIQKSFKLKGREKAEEKELKISAGCYMLEASKIQGVIGQAAAALERI